jgi:pimeloyl-ACP methyl ester carboxylesterase
MTYSVALAAGVAGVSLVEAPDYHHCLPIEKPPESLAAIRSFWETPL